MARKATKKAASSKAQTFTKEEFEELLKETFAKFENAVDSKFAQMASDIKNISDRITELESENYWMRSVQSGALFMGPAARRVPQMQGMVDPEERWKLERPYNR